MTIHHSLRVLSSRNCGRRLGVGSGRNNVFVLISDWQKHGDPAWEVYCFVAFLYFSHFILSFYDRINKKGSQKDQEQKKSGAYFFYEADAEGEDDDDDFDDI